jgi:transposase
MRSAKRPHRPEAEFFADPTDTAQRRYEALRAYFLEGATAAQAAARFGYAEASVQAMVRDFRRGDRDFFAQRRPGPATAPAKQAARAEVLRLRAAGHSVTEITAALASGPTPLNRTGVWELLHDEGYERLPTRPPDQRGSPRREHPPRTRRITWPPQPLRLPSDYAGVLLLVPGLVALDLPAAVSAARLPGTREVPALCSVL